MYPAYSETRMPTKSETSPGRQHHHAPENMSNVEITRYMATRSCSWRYLWTMCSLRTKHVHSTSCHSRRERCLAEMLIKTFLIFMACLQRTSDSSYAGFALRTHRVRKGNIYTIHPAMRAPRCMHNSTHPPAADWAPWCLLSSLLDRSTRAGSTTKGTAGRQKRGRRGDSALGRMFSSVWQIRWRNEGSVPAVHIPNYWIVMHGAPTGFCYCWYLYCCMYAGWCGACITRVGELKNRKQRYPRLLIRRSLSQVLCMYVKKRTFLPLDLRREGTGSLV